MRLIDLDQSTGDNQGAKLTGKDMKNESGVLPAGEDLAF